jgi:hypothetical protein
MTALLGSFQPEPADGSLAEYRLHADAKSGNESSDPEGVVGFSNNRKIIKDHYQNGSHSTSRGLHQSVAVLFEARYSTPIGVSVVDNHGRSGTGRGENKQPAGFTVGTDRIGIFDQNMEPLRYSPDVDCLERRGGVEAEHWSVDWRLGWHENADDKIVLQESSLSQTGLGAAFNESSAISRSSRQNNDVFIGSTPTIKSDRGDQRELIVDVRCEKWLSQRYSFPSNGDRLERNSREFPSLGPDTNFNREPGVMRLGGGGRPIDEASEYYRSNDLRPGNGYYRQLFEAFGEMPRQKIGRVGKNCWEKIACDGSIGESAHIILLAPDNIDVIRNHFGSALDSDGRSFSGIDVLQNESNSDGIINDGESVTLPDPDTHPQPWSLVVLHQLQLRKHSGDLHSNFVVGTKENEGRDHRGNDKRYCAFPENDRPLCDSRFTLRMLGGAVLVAAVVIFYRGMWVWYFGFRGRENAFSTSVAFVLIALGVGLLYLGVGIVTTMVERPPQLSFGHLSPPFLVSGSVADKYPSIATPVFSESNFNERSPISLSCRENNNGSIAALGSIRVVSRDDEGLIGKSECAERPRPQYEPSRKSIGWAFFSEPPFPTRPQTGPSGLAAFLCIFPGFLTSAAGFLLLFGPHRRPALGAFLFLFGIAVMFASLALLGLTQLRLSSVNSLQFRQAAERSKSVSDTYLGNSNASIAGENAETSREDITGSAILLFGETLVSQRTVLVRAIVLPDWFGANAHARERGVMPEVSTNKPATELSVMYGTRKDVVLIFKFSGEKHILDPHAGIIADPSVLEVAAVHREGNSLLGADRSLELVHLLALQEFERFGEFIGKIAQHSNFGEFGGRVATIGKKKRCSEHLSQIFWRVPHRDVLVCACLSDPNIRISDLNSLEMHERPLTDQQIPLVDLQGVVDGVVTTTHVVRLGSYEASRDHHENQRSYLSILFSALLGLTLLAVGIGLVSYSVFQSYNSTAYPIALLFASWVVIVSAIWIILIGVFGWHLYPDSYEGRALSSFDQNNKQWIATSPILEARERATTGCNFDRFILVKTGELLGGAVLVATDQTNALAPPIDTFACLDRGYGRSESGAIVGSEPYRASGQYRRCVSDWLWRAMPAALVADHVVVLMPKPQVGEYRKWLTAANSGAGSITSGQTAKGPVPVPEHPRRGRRAGGQKWRKRHRAVRMTRGGYPLPNVSGNPAPRIGWAGGCSVWKRRRYLGSKRAAGLPAPPLGLFVCPPSSKASLPPSSSVWLLAAFGPPGLRGATWF